MLEIGTLRNVSGHLHAVSQKPAEGRNHGIRH